MKVFVLGREISGEKFWRVTVLSAEDGAGFCLVRHSSPSSKKSGGVTVVPDLFDEAEILYSPRKAGTDGARFVKEYVLVARHAGIAANYAALVYAGRFAAVLAKNAFPPDARAGVFSICRNVINALAAKPRKEAAYLKALWLLARESGLPAREDWFERLVAADRDAVSAVLKTPLEALSVPVGHVEFLVSDLERWLGNEHEFSFVG